MFTFLKLIFKCQILIKLSVLNCVFMCCIYGEPIQEQVALSNTATSTAPYPTALPQAGKRLVSVTRNGPSYCHLKP